MQKLKSAFAIFILSVFLLSYLAREMHNFSHIHDNFCTSAEGHFHPLKPHCYLCDLTNDSTGLPFFYPPNLLLSGPGVPDFFFPETNSLLYEKDFRSLRAPPSLV